MQLYRYYEIQTSDQTSKTLRTSDPSDQ